MSFSISDRDLYPLIGRGKGLPILGALIVRRGATFSELLDKFKVSTATMSGTLKSLEGAGYVRRRKYGNRSFYSITEKGKLALDEFYDERRALDRVTDLVVERIDRIGLAGKLEKDEVRSIVEEEVGSFIRELDRKVRGRDTEEGE